MTLKIEQIIEIEKANPQRITEFCYEYGLPTQWFREKLTPKDLERGYVTYKCEACLTTMKYNLREPNINEKGGQT